MHYLEWLIYFLSRQYLPAKLSGYRNVLNSYTIDPAAQVMLQTLEVDNKACPGFELQDGLIKHEDKIWIGANAGLQTKLIQDFHSSPVGGGTMVYFLLTTELSNCLVGLA